MSKDYKGIPKTKKKTLNFVANELINKFQKFKKELDKHPKAIELIYSEETGYSLFIDLDLLKVPQ